MIAKEGAKDLMRRLHGLPALFSLAVNPLLLTMITTVHRYRGSLPGTRVALYAEICDVFLGKRQEAKGVSVELSPAQKMNVLQPLAYHMMCHGIREIPSSDAQKVIKDSLKLVKMQMTPLAFLQLIENTSGLLLERETGEYSFAHLTFQEYLTAKHVRENRLIAELKAGIEKSWWHETIRLYCAQDDATPIIAACIMKDHPSVSELTLAVECQKEALKVQSYINSQFDIAINRGAEDIDPLRRRVVAEALLAKRLREMTHFVSDVYIDTSLISCAEYQVFLDEQRNRGISRKPDHWIGEHFLPGQAYSPVLGVRLSDALAFCEWLTERESGVWRYRLPVLGEQQIDTKKYTVSLKQKIGYWLSDETSFTWLGGNLSPTDKPLNIESSRIQSRIFVSNRYEAVAIGNSLARVYILALIHDREFARILSSFLNTHDKKLIQNPTNDLNIVRAIDLARTLENDLDLTRALTYDFDLSSALFTDHVHALAQDIARVLGRDCTLIHNLLAHDRIIILNDAFTHSLIQALDQAYNYAVTFIQTKDANSFNGLYTTLVDILSHIARLVLDRGSDYNRLCRFICDLALIDMGITLLNNHFQFISEDGIQPTRPWWYLFQFHRRALQDDMEYKHNLQASCDIYENFLILEMRIQKKLPAYESILVVKERKKIDE